MLVNIYLSNYIRLVGLPSEVVKEISKELTLANPKYIENKRFNRWNGQLSPTIKLYKTKIISNNINELSVPRGFAFYLFYILKKNKLKWKLHDQRFSLEDIHFQSNIRLKAYQVVAVKKIIKKDFAVLSAPTGSGKTVMACHMIAERKQPTLIIVHTKELLEQWISRIETFLSVAKDKIGVLGAGKFKVEKISVGLVQTLRRRELGEIFKHFGHVIVDECHRTPSKTFSDVLCAFNGKYQLGLSATPYRNDGLSKLIFYYIGNVVHEISESKLIETGQILKPEVITRTTEFTYKYKDESSYQPMLSALTKDINRNLLIVSDVADESNKGEYCIILSDRKLHCNIMAKLLAKKGIDCAVLIGETPKAERQEIIENLEKGKLRVVLATGQLLGEGFDCKKLSRIFLTMPIKYKGRVKQYIGRVLRTSHGKNGAKIYDYADLKVGVLYATYKHRHKIFNELS